MERKPPVKLSLAERLMKNAEVFERHPRLGHFRAVDVYKIARDLRRLADTLSARDADKTEPFSQSADTSEAGLQ